MRDVINFATKYEKRNKDMKKAVKILALALVLVMAVTVLASCGKRLSGTWVTEDSNSVTFSGSNFSFVYGTIEMRGTYEIKKVGEDERIVLKQTQSVSNGVVTTFDTPTYIGGENGCEFRRGDGYIWISEPRYVKN